MPYTTPAEVRGVLVADGAASPSSDTSTAASMSDAALQAEIDEAIAEVDSKLHGASWPDPAPTVIRMIARDIAAYLATLKHRRGQPLDVDDPVRLRYGHAARLLDDIASGRAEIPDRAGQSALVAVNPYEGTLFRPQDLGLRTSTAPRSM